MLIAANRKPLGKIYLTDDDLDNIESQSLFAAKELRFYLGRMTTAVFEIAPCDGGDGIYVGKAASLDTDDLGEDGFAIETDDHRIRLSGGKRGVIYAAYELLERLGCRFFTPSCEKVPVITSLEIPHISLRQKPIVEYREHNYADVRQSMRFAVKCRLNGCHHPIPERMGGYMPYVSGWFVHTFENMVSVKEYGQTHPEYFALRDGKRLVRDGGRTQLCLTNPDVLKLCIASARQALIEHPDARIISISQNDWRDGNCECPNCRRVDEEEGSSSGSLLRFVNAVAEALEPEFPDVIFDTLAYHYSRPAPRLTRNRKNVCVRLCSIECCFSHPFETCDDEKRSVRHPDGSVTRFIDDLRNWGKICDRMYIWDYTTCFAHYPTPHPNWRVLQPNIQAMVKNNVRGIFEQANGASRGGVDFNELRVYLISKLLWDPYCDLAKHRREFMEFYYGAAAPALNEYLDLLCDVCEREDIHVGFNDNPVGAFLREDLLDQYDALFDRAHAAVLGDPLRLWRVEKARLSIRWVRIKRATMLRGEYDPVEIERFTADWRAYGLSRIDEWTNFESTHRALLDGKWRAVEYLDHWTGEEPEVL